MSALKDALKSTTSKGSGSTKDPKFYNNEKKLFIHDLATNPDEVIRVAVAGNDHVPAGTLKSMLATEIDIDVLRVILMNPRTPLKAIAEFTNDERAAAFDADDEVTEYLKARANVASATIANPIDGE